jgi:hypothetical protein|eukprot:COSAG01_NODE_19894_length_983_cov_1.369910_2_plen_62_part_00
MSGIRIIKFMNWEASFADKIGSSRDKELRAIRQSAVYKAMYFTVAQSVPIVIITVTFGVRR